MSRSDPRQLTARLRALFEPVAERFGCVLVAVEVLGSGGGGVLRVSVDKPGGATISDCASVSRAISPVLDVEDPLPAAYTLEVGTPGFERPVQRIEDFEYFKGCVARIKPYGVDGRRRLKGKLGGVEDGKVLLEVEGAVQALPLEDIERAHLVLEHAQYARMGQGLHPVADSDREGES